ncbi:Protein PLASTID TRANSCRIPTIONALLY ACTIVE 10 [Dionaea muscipula]
MQMQNLHCSYHSTILSPNLLLYLPSSSTTSKTLHKPSKALDFVSTPKAISLLLHINLFHTTRTKKNLTPRSYTSDEYAYDEHPLDEEFPEKYKNTISEEEARRRNWVERGWAPWEEILSPEADFAKKALNEGTEVPLKSPEAIEAFKMLKPSYRKKRMEEMGLTEDDYYERQFEIKGEILEPLVTLWDGPLVVRHVAPRDWPPRGWEVDREELEFIREGHKMMAERIDVETLKGASMAEQEVHLDTYRVFLKQYKHWVLHNKDRLEKESYKIDQDYHPGRRKRGKDYEEGMYELPFYYPGQICVGIVTTLHLYQGAFVDIGGVYEGWVPIKGNDWYWIRQFIKVGMQVIVEILAKRDPYRFRFPIEMRFVDPNIDHLIFNRFEFPPIFHRDEDTNPDEILRDSGRPPIPRKEPMTKGEEDPLVSDHPYVDWLWQIHVSEQMILDDMEANPGKYKGKKLSELTDDEEFDEEKSVEYTKAYYKKGQIPKVILKTSVRELDLESAFAERQLNNRLQKEAEERGEHYKVTKLRRNLEMDEYDLIHWRRSFEEREALIRDISCRQALGLPIEEPGRYLPASVLLKGQYDPSNPLYRYDYWGEPESSEKSKQERAAVAHNESIVGKGTLWYEMSYEDAIKQQKTHSEGGGGGRGGGAFDQDDGSSDEDDDDDSDDDDDDDDFDIDYSPFIGSSVEDDGNEPHVNDGTVSSSISNEGISED